MSWAMTDGEITSMWRTCKDRNAQVRILADLNVKSRKEKLEKSLLQTYQNNLDSYVNQYVF